MQERECWEWQFQAVQRHMKSHNGKKEEGHNNNRIVTRKFVIRSRVTLLLFHPEFLTGHTITVIPLSLSSLSSILPTN
jgi:hypothetical protein